MILNLTDERIRETISRMRADYAAYDKENTRYDRYRLTDARSDAWTCLIHEKDSLPGECVTVRLADLWQETIPGTEDAAVELHRTDGDDWYIALWTDGRVYEAEVQDIWFLLPQPALRTGKDGFPEVVRIQSMLLHSALVSLMEEAGILESVK